VPLFKRSSKPILAVDIDGVISLFGFEGSDAQGVASEPPPGEFHLVDGMLHCISRPAGERLLRLSDAYDLVWCSGWEDRANDHLTQILGLPKLPYLTFDGRAQFGTAHWKLAPLERYASDRPLAWIDDSLDDSCYEWADRREEPTLLVPTDSERGLEEGHVATLEAWVRDGFTPR
jgi:HAD domain in Swiss Army Knife RNA repair proteins